MINATTPDAGELILAPPQMLRQQQGNKRRVEWNMTEKNGAKREIELEWMVYILC